MAESDQDLPKGLVDISDAHCPIVEPTNFGLPFHGLVVNGELTLPNGKIIKYPQPRAMQHYTSTYYNPGNYWCTNNGGFYAPSGWQVVNYVRDYFGSTILVRGSKAKIPERSKKEEAEDLKNGHQWKDYAYLSGTLRQIGASELEPGTLNGFGDGVNNNNTAPSGGKEVSVIALMYNQGYWLYNDGDTTWLMKWTITPATTDIKGIWIPGVGYTNYADPERTLTIWVMKPFGLFGVDGASSMSPKKIFEGNWDINAANRASNNGSPVYLPFYSADGSTVSISEVWHWFSFGCSDPYTRYWMVQFLELQWTYDPQMCDLNTVTGYWSVSGGETWIWADLSISGKGSLKKSNFGEGIKITFSPKFSGNDWVPPGSDSYSWWGCIVCACVNPNGVRGYWWIEAWDPLPGVGYLKSTWGHSIEFFYFTSYGNINLLPCYQGIEAPYRFIQQGVSLLDNGTMVLCWTGSNPEDFTTVHLQTGSSCPGGISYDIVNDKWSTIKNSCYV